MQQAEREGIRTGAVRELQLLNSTWTVPVGQLATDLLDDASCFLSEASAVLLSAIHGDADCQSSLMCAALRLVDLSKAALDAANQAIQCGAADRDEVQGEGS